MNKKRIRGFLLFIVFIAVCAAAVTMFLKKDEKKEADNGAYKTETVRRGTVTAGISENGAVEFGTTEQTFSVAEITEVSVSEADSSTGNTGDASGTAGGSGMTGGSSQNAGSMSGMNMGMNSGGMTASAAGTGESSGQSTSLIVEEVYLATGQMVEKGAPVLKITQESIAEYRRQLEAAEKTAELKVSQEEINVESKKAEADYTYEMYLAQGETAEETYQATITSLETAITDLEEELAEAEANGDEEEIEALEAELKIAKNNLTTKSIEAKQTYENAMTNYKYAQQLYQIDTNGLEDDLNDAKKTLEEAKQNLSDFEEQIGDGIVYAEYSGTVMEMAYAAGDTLANDSIIVSFTDTENVTMTVSVSQEDISQVAVGNEVSIRLTAYADKEFPGEVISIASSSSVGSSTVNYDVSVRFTGDTGKVYSGMTGDVTFAGKTVSDILYISNKAVFLEGGRSYVKVLESDGSIQTTEISTGFSNGTIVAVESGLEEDQTVIIESKVAG